MKNLKKIAVSLAGIVTFIALINFLHAQDTASPFQLDSATVAGMSDLEVELKAVESVPPMPAESLPEAGTFWSAQHAPGTADEWPPLPTSFGMGAWSLGDDGVYLLADLNHVYGHPIKSKKAASLTATTSVGGTQIISVMSAMDMNPGDGGDDTNDDGGGSSPLFVGTPINTNTLWLQIFSVSNGVAYLSLNNATDQVYEVTSRTNLVSPGWNIETELFPTNGTAQTNALPFTVPEGNRTSTLFLRSRDWTGITSNGNMTPDWWLWKYFGTTALLDTNLDSQGNTLLHDYTNRLDPNIISFTLAVTNNNYVNSMNAQVQLNITGGTPSYYAVLVNDTNMADASWQPYTTSNLVVYLGISDGAYNVSVGLRGLPANATQTWQSVALIKDTVAPVVVITNPTVTTVSVPMIQLQGFASKNLGSLTFDVSNAVGIVTNQTGSVTGEFYDTNLLEFTTNYFQCYDIALTNGLNKVTLHATDLAGNTTTVSYNFNLDYSGDTTPPALAVLWPQDGTYICGTNFTVRAQVDDDTASVTASIVNTNGATNMVQGLVEGSGLVWVENLPLASGANILTLTARDAAGNTSTTNLTLYQSSVSVTLDPLPNGQLNQPFVNVTGTVSDPTAEVWVNGTQATVNGDGTWEADGVTVGLGGTGVFDVEVYAADYSPEAMRAQSKISFRPADDSGNTSIGSQNFTQAQPVTVVVSSYAGYRDYVSPTNLAAYSYSNDVFTEDEFIDWNWQAGGTFDYEGPGLGTGGPAAMPPDDAGFAPPVASDFYYGFIPWVVLPISLGGGLTDGTPPIPPMEYGYLNSSNLQRSVQTTVMIAPQGKALAGTTKLYMVRARALEFSDPFNPNILDPETVNFQYLIFDASNGYAGNVPLPPECLQINGHVLINSGITAADGSVWGYTVIQAASDATPDVTPKVIPTVTLTNNDYTFNVQAVEIYPPAVDANRDGSITFDSQDQTTQSNPYRFWVNNDYDGYDSSIGDYDDLDPSTDPVGSDAANTSISCTRDLEDYSRLWINTQGITTELQNGNLLLALEWKNVTAGSPGIRVFQAVETNGGTLYLTDEATALAQSNAPYGNCIVDSYVGQTAVSGSLPFIIPTSFWANISGDQPVAHLLFDAVSRGNGQLVVAIYKKDGVTKLAEGEPLYLDLQDVKEMYERYTVGENPSSAPATTASVVADPYSYDSTISADNNYILFVHGWNLPTWEKDAFAETAFKRLYWQGYKGHFGEFRWPTGYGITGVISAIGDADNYDKSESNAWASATGLLGLLNSLNSTYPGQVYLIAHSMGNVVAGEALKLSGANQVVNTYVAMQAATASHAYDPTTYVRTNDLNFLGIGYSSHAPNYYASYYTNGAPSYFNSTAGAGSYINFYNQQDYALSYWEVDEDFKPDDEAAYWYSGSNTKFYFGGIPGFGGGTELDFPTATYQIFAYCDTAFCYGLGEQAFVGGKFQTSQQVDLGTTFGFGNSHADHSGEFNSDNMSRATFWHTLLTKIRLSP
jgi:hypothetical protein